MSLWRRLFGTGATPAPLPPSLRNKPGGLAWIRGIPELDGRIVTTVQLAAGTFWAIDPQQVYVSARHEIATNGQRVKPGDTVRTVAIIDSCLEPIGEVGDGEKDQSLAWLPPVPAMNPDKVT